MGLPRDIWKRDTRANQPTAASVAAGTIYYVTDELVTERSSGSAWQDISDGGHGISWIEEQTPSAVASITFSSLGSYTHLEIRWSARSSRASVNSDDLTIRFNADTGNNYDTELLYNNAATTAAAYQALAGAYGIVGTTPAATADASKAGGGIIQIPDYRGTTFHKTACGTHHAPIAVASTLQTRVNGISWRSAVAITSITLFLGAGAGTFVAGSKFTLYGYR